jgi:DivIVA domain-containing protein
MPLTPAEVHNVVFKKPPIGKRGYDEEEVDAFLDIIEVELARLIEENADLKGHTSGDAVAEDGSALAAAREENRKLTSRIGELESALTQARQPSANQPAANQNDSAALTSAHEENRKLTARIAELEAAVSQARQAVIQAQQEAAAAKTAAPAAGGGGGNAGNQLSQAERVLALAQQAADEQTAAAKSHSEKTIAEAKAHHERVQAEARAFHEKTLSEAQSRAEQLDRDSRAKATSTVQEAEQRANQITSQLEQRKAALEKRLEELRTFEHEYRSRLKSYLESQLRDLDTSTRAEPANQASGSDKQHG